MKKIITLSFSLIGLFIVANFTQAAEGDLIWSKTNNPDTQIDEARGVAVDSTGVYVVGYVQIWQEWHGITSWDSQWRIEKRSKDDGSLIWAQNSDPDGWYAAAYGVAVDSTGIYVVGYDSAPTSTDHQWRIEKRSKDDGSLIWARVNNPSSGYMSDRAHGVAVDSTGIYVVGESAVLSPSLTWNAQWRIEKRSLTDGSLIWSQENNPSDRPDTAHGVAIDSTGIYVVGYDWRIEKRSKDDGSLIWANPYTYSNFSANAVTVDCSGFYVVGTTYWSDGVSTNHQWRIEKRSLIDGSQIWYDVIDTDWHAFAYGVAVDNTGVYAVGVGTPTGSINYHWRIQKRSLIDGSLTWSQVSDPSPTFDTALGVAVDGTGIYVVGYDYVYSSGSVYPTPRWNEEWRIEKRKVSGVVDCGLRVFDGSQIVKIACEPGEILSSPLRIRNGATTYGIVLTCTSDVNASKVRIRIISGRSEFYPFDPIYSTVALRKLE